MRIGFLLAWAALAAAPVMAARDLPVPADKGWQHADSGLILPATLDGLARTRLADNTDSERDVYADFRSADGSVDATVYLFHPAINDVAMWFDRAQAAIMARDLFGSVSASGIAPVAFTPPHSSTASGLRQSYTPTRRTIRGTALAVMPLGEWLVTVRVSSPTLDAAAADARMSRVIAAMRWPQGAGNAPAATPIASCSDALMSLVLGTALHIDTTKAVAAERVRWCRDAASASRYGIYRSPGAGYQIALGDAGRVMHVTPTLDTQLGKGNSYSVSLTDADDSVRAYPSFTGLPSPEQAIALIGGRSSGTATSKDGKTNITLPSK